MSTQHTPETLKQARAKQYGLFTKKPYREGCCCYEVRASGPFGTYNQCERKNGFGPAGLYCKQHDPEAVKRKRDAARAKYDAKWTAVASRANREKECVNALLGVSDPAQAIAKAREVLKTWLRYVEEELTCFDTPGDPCEAKDEQDLCPRCKNVGCIWLKIKETREAIALLGEPEEQK